jgi:hypothetical protein
VRAAEICILKSKGIWARMCPVAHAPAAGASGYILYYLRSGAAGGGELYLSLKNGFKPNIAQAAFDENLLCVDQKCAGMFICISSPIWITKG